MFRDRHERRTGGEKDGLAVKSWQRKEKEEKSSVDVCNHYRDKTKAKLPITLQQRTDRMCESVTRRNGEFCETKQRRKRREINKLKRQMIRGQSDRTYAFSTKPKRETGFQVNKYAACKQPQSKGYLLIMIEFSPFSLKSR